MEARIRHVAFPVPSLPGAKCHCTDMRIDSRAERRLYQSDINIQAYQFFLRKGSTPYYMRLVKLLKLLQAPSSLAKHVCRITQPKE